LLLRRCGRPPGVNMNGTDFIPQLLRACDGLPVAVLGLVLDVLIQWATGRCRGLWCYF
jgi:hypothetical protein